MSNVPNLVLVDDHSLLRSALARVLESELGFPVLYECNNGNELKKWLVRDNEPDIILMDINMPGLDGYETISWLKEAHPEVKVIVLSMSDDETSIMRMVKNGARGYVLKDVSPTELKTAIASVSSSGYYYSELVSGTLLHAVHKDDDEGSDLKKVLKLKEKDIGFLKLVDRKSVV